jgi:16S rRNA (adenine1518-N6/adenine1519-N6)-dimethyltransferase
VRSMVVRLILHAPLFEIRDRRVYADVVRALFSHRRKTVRNGLRTSAGILQKDQVEHMLAMLPDEILNSRPEALYLEDFATIANLG